MQHQEKTHQIIGCAMKVHTELGSGFQEVIYQRSLEIEFHRSDIPYVREFEMPVMYQEHQVGTRRVDFLVFEHIMVELKAVSVLEDVHLVQAKNYLQAYNVGVGLLLNFGTKSLQYKRLFNNAV